MLFTQLMINLWRQNLLTYFRFRAKNRLPKPSIMPDTSAKAAAEKHYVNALKDLQTIKTNYYLERRTFL